MKNLLTVLLIIVLSIKVYSQQPPDTIYGPDNLPAVRVKINNNFSDIYKRAGNIDSIMLYGDSVRFFIQDSVFTFYKNMPNLDDTVNFYFPIKIGENGNYIDSIKTIGDTTFVYIEGQVRKLIEFPGSGGEETDPIFNASVSGTSGQIAVFSGEKEIGGDSYRTIDNFVIANSYTAIGNNTYSGSANGVTAFGAYSLYNGTSGDYLTAIGTNSLFNNTTGQYSTAVGASALYSNTTGKSNIAIGRTAGLGNTTQSNRLYINSISRGGILEDTTKSIIYGLQAATTANQQLYFNANVNISNNLKLSTLPQSGTYNLGLKNGVVDTLSRNDSILADTVKTNHIKGLNSDTITFGSKVEFQASIEVSVQTEDYSASKTFDFSQSSFQFMIVTGEVTVNITNLPEGVSTLWLQQNATGYTITPGTGWGTAFDNTGSLGTTANANYVIQFINNGTDILHGIATQE